MWRKRFQRRGLRIISNRIGSSRNDDIPISNSSNGTSIGSVEVTIENLEMWLRRGMQTEENIENNEGHSELHGKELED